MRKALRYMTIAILLFLQFQLALSPAEARKRRLPGPILTAFQAEQAGDSLLELFLEGSALPRPEVTSSGQALTEIFLPGVRFPAVRHERELDTPLALRLCAEELPEGALVRLFTEAPLSLRGVRGVGSSRLRLLLASGKKAGGRKAKELFADADDGAPFMNRKITLSVRDGGLGDVLRLMGAAADVNILLDPGVKKEGTLTLSFAEAPFGEVLRFVLAGRDLGFSLTGRTVVVGPRSSAGLLKGRRFTKSYPLSYADAAKTAPLLKEIAELSSPVEKIWADERQNLLILSAVPDHHERVRQALKELDAPGRQVMIKARILEVNKDASQEVETAINAVYDWWWASSQGGALSAGYAQSGQKPGAGQGPLLNLADDASLPGAIGDGVTSLAGTATRMLDLRLKALVQDHKARVLADPAVTVLDGEKASVRLVDRLKFVSSRDDARNPTYEDEEVGPRLEVTPRVGRNGVITIKVRLETGEVVQWIKGGQGEEIPQISSRSLETTVRVRDGEPFVTGGLFKENVSKKKFSIPVLSSIPLLGEFFKTQYDKKTQSQLLMVLIPYIIEIPDLAISGKTL